MPTLSTFEVRGDRVVAVTGDQSDSARSQFASEAEGLQGKAFLIAKSIGMSAVTCAAATFESGSLAFRFAGSSSDTFDVKGLTIDSTDCATSSLMDSLA